MNNLHWKWINLKVLELKVILDVEQNKSETEGIPKREEIPIKGKNDFKTFSSRRYMPPIIKVIDKSLTNCDIALMMMMMMMMMMIIIIIIIIILLLSLHKKKVLLRYF